MARAARELRRGLSADNLRFGALAAAALGVVALLATRSGAAPDVLGRGALVQALVAAGALFVTLTVMHTAAHTYFGWRFERGLRAAGAGEHRRAVQLLGPVERPGMGHYDLDGAARRALQASRAALASG
jgi:hypothetical protein